MRYMRRVECGEPEEISLAEFVKGFQSEFMFGENYYEHMLVLLGCGHKMVGSFHMYWVECDKEATKA